MEIRQKLRIFHHWPIFGSVHFLYPEFGFSFLNLYVKLHFSSKILNIQGGEGRNTVPYCVWKPKMVKNRAQKTSADFNTYLVNRKPQREYKKDLWRNLGKNFFFRFFFYILVTAFTRITV